MGGPRKEKKTPEIFPLEEKGKPSDCGTEASDPGFLGERPGEGQKEVETLPRRRRLVRQEGGRGDGKEPV